MSVSDCRGTRRAHTVAPFLLWILPITAAAQANLPLLPAAYDGPPVPVAPSVITREAGTYLVTIRATRVAAPLRIDGRLDEPVYAEVPPMSDFIQVEPHEGQPSSQRTEVWLLFDREHVYVTVRCWEDHPDRMVANEMRRDIGVSWSGNDNIAFIFDTFYDRRNGVLFMVTPLGARSDGQFANERVYNGDYNPIWTYETRRFEGGWVVETAVPFKSLRYQPGTQQVWGFNVIRNNFWKNEIAYLVPMPASYGRQGIMLSSRAATVVGIEAPAGSKNLEVKPYAIGHVATDLSGASKTSSDLGGEAGFDVKYGITESMILDITYNTDFAQVEADQQQVNLTRFSLFFPEKREFFLENQGTFEFGGVGGRSAGSVDTPILFYSRRIGLEAGRAVPLVGGGRLTGRIGRFSIGALNIQSDDERAVGAGAPNFSVVRAKRDILRRSAIGLLYAGRSSAADQTGRNDTLGADGTFSFFTNLAMNAYWARTNTDGRHGDDMSYRAQLLYSGDRYGVQLEQLSVGADFNPEIGFVRRTDIRRSHAGVRFSPRPRASRVVRKYTWRGSATYVENGDGRVENRIWDGEFGIELQNSDVLLARYVRTYEFLPRTFEIASGVALPIGRYEYDSAMVEYAFGQQRKLAGTVQLEAGTFYNGRKSTLNVTGGRVQVTPRFSLEPNLSLNSVRLSQGAFTNRLIGSRVTYTMTPMMFASALVQYNSATNSFGTNARLRWEYQPGSELFIVFNEERDTRVRTFPELVNRAFIVKINRLFRF